MHPSSIFKYFINNKKRFAIVTLAIMLGVLLLYSLSTVINSMEASFKRSTLDPMANLSVLEGRGSFLPGSTVSAIKQMDSVVKVIPAVEYSIPLKLVVGGFNSTSLFIVDFDDIDYLMELMGLKLVSGRTPVMGSLEVALHKEVARNMGVKVGDRIGSGLNSSVWLPEQYTVVGLIGGDPLVSFGGLLISQEDAERRGILIVPKAGERGETDKYLQSLESTQTYVRTLSTANQSLAGTVQSVDILITGIGIMVVIIVSACVGFLCYIYYMQRQNEYGLLWAIGFTRQQVINRAFAEIGVMNLAGFAAGLLASIIAGLVMKIAFYQGLGQVLYVFNPDALAKAACVPIFATFFSLVPIWRLMKKFDPVHVMDS